MCAEGVAYLDSCKQDTMSYVVFEKHEILINLTQLI